MPELKIPEMLLALLTLILKETKVQVSIQSDFFFTEHLDVKNGVRQRDALVCLLFNIALEKVIRDSNINIRGNISVQILAYADDIGIIARTAPALKQTFMALEQSAKRFNLSVNENKTKYLACVKSNLQLSHIEISNCKF
ncbi:putative endonuclease-reverse transcriptase [Trichonephila clavipes]|nr:putative endonuclease-reverse transcriptase [Trichonephila clavipes]